MGCSQSNVQSQVVTSINVKTRTTIVPQHRPSTQQSNRILENCIVVWFLPDSIPDMEDMKTKLQHVVSLVKIFHNADECATYITKIRIEKIFLILPTIINSLLPSIQCLPQIEKIYIFNLISQPNEYEPSSSNIFSDIHLLCTQLHTDVELCEHDLIDIIGSVVWIENGTPTDEFKKQEASFLYVQLIREILFRLKFETNAKNEFVNFFRTHYSHNDEQLRIIDDFEKLYRPQQAIRWLIRKCFIWKVLQRIQRTQEIDILYKMGFLLKHIYTQFNVFQENNSSNTDNTWIVYYGKTMVNDRFDTMVKNNSGGLLCFANFFKTNTDKNVEINCICHHLSTKTNVTGIIFEIHLNSTKRSTRSPFASLDEIYLSEITEKNGIFFSMFTVFRIESIEQIIENSITMWLVKLTLVVDNDPQLLRIVAPLRSTEVDSNPISYLGKLCMDKGDYDQAERFFLGMLQDTSVLNQPRRLARVQKGLAANYMNKNEYTKALEHFQQALKASLSYLPSDHIDLGSLYDGIGSSYYKQGDYNSALQNYEKAANLLQSNKQPSNDQQLNDLNLRIDSVKKLLANKQLL